MPAYYRAAFEEFATADPSAILGQLQAQYAKDGYSTQFSSQTRAWADVVPLLQCEVRRLGVVNRSSAHWTILLEFPLYRLRKRIDAVVLTGSVIAVIEVKAGERHFLLADVRQVEEYALDLRDFHEGSRKRLLVPLLWATEASTTDTYFQVAAGLVAPVQRVGKRGVATILAQIPAIPGPPLLAEMWESAAYRPVPSVIDAATTIFAGHDVRSIAQADASNLRDASARLVALIAQAKREGRHAVIFLTGVPGSGKTLAGLQVVHDAIATGAEQRGDIVYLSGNTPLVTVLREALARNQYSLLRFSANPRSLHDVRRDVRARIQHINDFLRQSLANGADEPPHEHAIVFDEAQRAWDERQGQKKFSRTASEPALLLELMRRHRDWSACICLVGGGQEINTGEQGISGWGAALRALKPEVACGWSVVAPPEVVSSDRPTGDDSLGHLPAHLRVQVDAALHLDVPMRTFRSPTLNAWVACVLAGDSHKAKRLQLT